MGFRLSGNGGESLNWTDWWKVLDVAYAFGWQPMGTAPPDRWKGEWKGEYNSNSGQLVTEPDARALSNALYRAIRAIEVGEILNDEQANAIHFGDDDFSRAVRAWVAGENLDDERRKVVRIADYEFFRALVILARGEILNDEQAQAPHASNDEFWRAIRSWVAAEHLDDEQAKAVRGTHGARDKFLLRFAQYIARGAFRIF